jgi:predicted dehydrogenase
LNIGIVGAGSFAHFAAKAFLKLTEIKIVAVSDINETAANEMAVKFNAKSYTDYETFLKDSNIDLIYIATPPFLHYRQSKQALLAGKHVICEKPATLCVNEAEELVMLAGSSNLLYVVNLMQRYNPLYAIVKNILTEKLIGNFLHGFFENYASDENLNTDHWFWDEAKSGGIFIEHGVHFFDLFEGWLGEGKVLSALQLQRPCVEERIIDRVQATVLYKEGAVNFYHGFDQPKILDRQEMRLQFEHGEITLYGWIPVRMRLHGLFQKEQLGRFKELLINFSIEHHNNRQPGKRKIRGRFSEIIFDNHVTIEYGNISEKGDRYREMLTDMLADQWTWIKDHTHIRVIDAGNAVRSLKMAEKANRAAQNFNN